MNSNIGFISKAKVAANNPLFLQRIFTQLSKAKKRLLIKEKDPLKRAILEEYSDLSRRADRAEIQKSCSIRNVLRTREIAKCLINEKGHIEKERVVEAISLLKENLYSLGPDRQYDSERQEYLLSCLEKLPTNKELTRLIKSIQKPHAHPFADGIIRQTLNLPEKASITDAHARQAALAAWFCYLRQSVGSCFATAPAIIVHEEQPEQFFSDIRDLFATGQIKRTFAGVEYSVPLSPSWGAGDLKRLIVVQCTTGEDDLELWLSPGLMTGFEAVDLVDSEKPLRSRIKEVKDIVTGFIEEQCGKEGQLLTSAEVIIKRVLMKEMHLTDQDLHEYQNRPPGMVGSGGLMQISRASGGGKASLCKRFYAQQQKAHDAFKSLADNALLKTWEFTIASFAETKPAFTRWNLYASLGFRPEQPGGIGECLVGKIKEKLEDKNRKVVDLNDQYEQMYPHIRYLETRIRTASTEEEARWLKIDYNAKANEFKSLEEMRNRAQSVAQWFANLYNVFIHYYDQLFPKYFQEIYDADMHDVGRNPYDDSPAGFRLIYKYGRANTSQWTRIHDAAEYIDALTNFFNATEREMNHFPEFEGQEKELSDLVTAVVNHVRTMRFLETSFDRMAAAHHTPRVEKPLENLDKIDKKPWVYTSGGSLNNLIKCYWRREEELTEESRWVENQTELFVFLVDTLKKQSNQVMDSFTETPNKSMLIHSPTHAFLLKPGKQEFNQVWQSKDFTYTWIRDRVILPRDRFVDRIQLDAEKMQYLIEVLANQLPAHYRHYFHRVFSNMWGTHNSVSFRREMMKGMSRERGLQFQGMPVLSEEKVDQILYEELPLFNIKDLDHCIQDIIKDLPGVGKVKKEEFQEAIDAIRRTLIGTTVLGAKQLLNIAASVLLIILGDNSYPYDYHKLIVESAREHGLAMPKPVIFADTNWVCDKFAFLVSPGSGKLELWRTDPLGSVGSPMISWKQWLDGSRRDREWGVYVHPYEYVSTNQAPFGF